MRYFIFLIMSLCMLQISAVNMHNDSIFPKTFYPYKTWDNTRVNCYNSADIPDVFNIHLIPYSMPIYKTFVTSHYGFRAKYNRMHKGVDLKLYIGDTVYSPWDGVVRLVKYEPKGYGNYIVVRHQNGLETVYGHLSKHLVKVNQEVKRGEPIGLGGNTGRSTGSHLHFETRIMGVAIDPEILFDFKLEKPKMDVYKFEKTKSIKS